MNNERQNIVYDCIVIGAGISGISFAHYLHKIGKKVLVIEKENTIGGRIKSLPSDCKAHYWRELGAHTCYNSYTNLLSIAKEVEGNDLFQPLEKFSYVVYDSDKIKSIFSAMSILPFIVNAPKIFFSNKENKTVRQYFRPIVGASNYDRLFKNAFKAVICQDADDYPAEMFLKKRKTKEEELPRRFTFKNGISSFLNAIVEKDSLEIIYSSAVSEIQKAGSIFNVKTPGIYKAHNIAIATDPQTSSVLMEHVDSRLSDLLSTIPLFKVESLNVILPKNKLQIKKIAGVIPLSNEFLSVVSRDLVNDTELRSFTFHFEKGKKNEKEKKELISNVLDISFSDVIEFQYAEHILPSMRLDHLHMDKKIDENRIDRDIYVLGNYFYGLSLEDCVNRSKDEFERFCR